MNKILYGADERGHADFGWLQAKYTFSFARYYNPKRMNFGLLRVLNDDVIAPGHGFTEHPHDNMEIVSIPLAGALVHRDSTGGEGVIRHGEVQLMSAGSGVRHSEANYSQLEPTKLLQIWVLPKKHNIEPRYQQAEFAPAGRKNQLQFVVAPLESDVDGLKMNQDAYFALTDLDQEESIEYSIQVPGNGLFVMNLRGDLAIANEQLGHRDALGLEFKPSDASAITVKANKDSQILFIEVPMQ